MAGDLLKYRYIFRVFFTRLPVLVFPVPSVAGEFFKNKENFNEMTSLTQWLVLDVVTVPYIFWVYLFIYRYFLFTGTRLLFRYFMSQCCRTILLKQKIFSGLNKRQSYSAPFPAPGNFMSSSYPQHYLNFIHEKAWKKHLPVMTSASLNFLSHRHPLPPPGSHGSATCQMMQSVTGSP